jgi:hypothetical protein
MQPNIYIERKNEQNYHKTTYPTCVNCTHCEIRSMPLPNNDPEKKPISVHLMPRCGLGKFHVTVNGSCDRFEYSHKSARRVERREKLQTME